MIRFAQLDENGNPTFGGTRKELPEGAVELPEQYSFRDLPRLQYRNGAWEERKDYVPPSEREPTDEDRAMAQAAMLARARAEAGTRINAAVGEVRKRIYTDITGQDALYLEKRAEAVAYVAEARGRGEPETLADYPLLANEVGVTAPTPWTLAQLWLNRSDQFKRVGAATERLRMQALVDISTAPDIAALEAIERNFTEALNRLPL
jgi:hypothetical protein